MSKKKNQKAANSNLNKPNEKSSAIDKQLMETFATYVVAPMDGDLKGQLDELQKKWIGDEKEFSSSDDPYLTQLLGNGVQAIKTKIEKLSQEIQGEFGGLSSVSQDVGDVLSNTVVIAEKVDTVDEKLQKVAEKADQFTSNAENEFQKLSAIPQDIQKNSDKIEHISELIGSKADALLEKTEIFFSEVKALAKQAESSLQTIEESIKKEVAFAKEHTDSVVGNLQSDVLNKVSDLTQRTTENYDFLSTKLDKIEKNEEEIVALATATTKAQCECESFLKNTLEEQKKLIEKQIALKNENKAIKKMLYISLILNGVALLGIAATFFALF